MGALSLVVLSGFAGFAAFTACSHGASHDGGGFRVFFPEARASSEVAEFSLRSDQRVQLKPSAHCQYEGGKDARWTNTGARVVEGQLPPGLALEDGAIAGVPSQSGHWDGALRFTGLRCGSEAQPDQTVRFTIVVTAGR